MPLLPTILVVQTSNRHYVRFPMENGKKPVTVHIAAAWLEQRAVRDGLKTDNLVLLYSYYREEIERAASAKYDQSHCDGADVVVVARDLI